MAWPSLREQILEELKATFAGITVANGYNLTVKTVSRDIVHPNQLSDDALPVIFISAVREIPAHRSFQKIRNIFQPTLTFYVTKVTGEEVATTIEKLIQDIRTIFYVAIKRGGVAESSLAGETRIDKGIMLPMAGGEMDLEIPYRHPRGTP